MRLLCPTDFSESARRAAGVAVALALKLKLPLLKNSLALCAALHLTAWHRAFNNLKFSVPVGELQSSLTAG